MSGAQGFQLRSPLPWWLARHSLLAMVTAVGRGEGEDVELEWEAEAHVWASAASTPVSRPSPTCSLPTTAVNVFTAKLSFYVALKKKTKKQKQP